MKLMSTVLLMLCFSSFAQSETFSDKIASIRLRYPSLNAHQVSEIVQDFVRMEINGVFRAPGLIDTGVDYSRGNATTDMDGQGTHVAGVVDREMLTNMQMAAPSADSEIAALQALHPEISEPTIREIIKILKGLPQEQYHQIQQPDCEGKVC